MLFSPPTPIHLPVTHIQQRISGECLAACTAMILTYLRIPASYSQLLKLLDIEPLVGAPFSKIHAVEKLGIAVLYQKHGSLAMLYDYLSQSLPIIVDVETQELPYWQQISARHVVVVVGMDAQHIYLNDPQFPTTAAPMAVALGDFDLAWLERDERYALLSPR
jgi:ABC-type bacteriocin/lantibiotic exporter with double-glycine peptidase domain